MRRAAIPRALGCGPRQLLCIWVIALGCASAPLDQQRWIEARSPNFTVMSRLSEEKTIELQESLELFRSVVIKLTNVRDLESNVPTKIYLFGGGSDFRQIEGDKSVAGRFIPTMRDNTVVLRKTRFMDTARILQHEYVHFIINSATAAVFPPWYNEGFAEYLSTVDVEDGMVRLGWYPEDRIDAFRYLAWIPLAEVIDPGDRENWSDSKNQMFYAESWSLVHYLHHGRGNDRSLKADLNSYLSLIGSGRDARFSFEEAFGQGAESMDKEVKRYVYAGKFPAIGIPATEFEAEPTIEVRMVPPAEIAAAMGAVLLRYQRPADARPYFERAIANDPSACRSHAGLGDTYKFEGHWEDALPHFERAVEIGPDDAICQLDFAEYWHSRAIASEDPSEFLGRARERYVASWKLDDQIPETYAMYGETFLLEGGRADKALEMLEMAESLLPSDLNIRLAVATAYFELDEPEKALARARSVEALSHPGSEAAIRARQLIDAHAQEAGIPTTGAFDSAGTLH